MAIFGFDLGYKTTTYALVDTCGNFVEKGKFATPEKLEDFYQCLAELRGAFQDDYLLEGAGFSLPGAADNTTGVVGGASAFTNSKYFNIHGFNIKEKLMEALSMPVAIANDANCAALGEAWVGAAREYQDVAFLAIGHGVGGAMVLDKQIRVGSHFHGGEFGYMPMTEDGATLSGVASVGAVVRGVSKLNKLPKSQLTDELIFSLVEQGDPEARMAMKRLYRYLARGICTIQYSFDPDVFVLGGTMAQHPGFIDEVNHQIRVYLEYLRIGKVVPKVLLCTLGDDANLLGAASYYLTQCV